MYKRILVPLDGSDLAECVLPHVASISEGCNVMDVVFVRVVEPVEIHSGGDLGGSFRLTDEQMKEVESSQRTAAEEYLDKVASQMKQKGVITHSKILLGKVADTISNYASNNEVDLIIIATHGRTGVSRWVWGSSADRVLRSSCVPVLMVRAPGCVSGI
ncbi:universal stress protein [Chloroflexota bacterium]